jgi:ADP-heptose:LPS heptosyltransferase|tara:strand:- start:10258 stop:11388 length:1131 start_codon:yes stop_codon:yes gene_type:complete
MIYKLRTYLLTVLSFFLYPFLSKQKLDFSEKRILIIPQLTRIGDLICVTPAFREIKRKYPKSFLAVVVSYRTAGIIKNNPYIDEIIILEEDEYRRVFGILRFFKKIKSQNFDYSINIASSTMGTLISIFGLIPNRVKIIKYDRPFTETLTDWMNTHKTFYKGNERIPNLYLRTLNVFNIQILNKIKKEVFTTFDTENKSIEFFKKNNISEKDFIIGISVSAGNKVKEWEVEKFGKLSKLILNKYNTKIIFIGRDSDKEKISAVNKHIENKGIEVTDFSLEELPSLMKRFNVFIAVDSGTIHIAHALGVPLVDIIGPVDSAEQAPDDDRSIIVRPDENIKPTIFALKPLGNPEQSRKALESISPEQVFKAFNKLLTK